MPKAVADKVARKSNRYGAIIERVFGRHYKRGLKEFEFTRDEFANAAKVLDIVLPKNLGDVIYTFRYRHELPESVNKSATAGNEWIIEGAGIARYRFREVRRVRIVPSETQSTIKIPDATPQIITTYELRDEQALLAKLRYNRLVDIFLGITTFSLQNHFRTTVTGIGQVEIDEIYGGVDRYGRKFVVPLQAKGGKDRHGVMQTRQDFECCAEKFPDRICRAISAQFMTDNRIAMFELKLVDGEVKVDDEKHYQLVPASAISRSDLRQYGNSVA